MTLKFVNPDTHPCLTAFIDEMRARCIKAEPDENGPNMFKDPRIEAMWEGFICGWITRGPADGKRSAAQPTDILTKLAALTQSSSNDLRPCPFCGNPGEIEFWEENEGSTNGYYPQCSYCCAEIEGLYTMDGAISAWNARPREAALIALVQDAAGEIEHLILKT